MSILEKLQSDMEDDAYFNLSLEERYELLKRDAETIAKRLDAVVAAIRDNAESACCCEYNSVEEIIVQCDGCDFVARAVAIAEGREP